MQEKDLLLRQLRREKLARKEAESIIEQKSEDIYRANQALQKREEQTHAILEATPDALVVLDENLCIQMCNKSSCALFDYERVDLLGKSIVDLLIEGKEKKSFFTQPQGNILSEFKALQKTGATIPVELSVSKVHLTDEVFTICILRNIFERKRAELYLSMEHAVARILSEYETYEAAMPKILQVMCETLSLEIGGFWVVNEKTKTLHCEKIWVAQRSESLDHFEKISLGIVFEKGIGLPGRIWESKKAQWINDVVEDVNFPRAPWALKANLHSAFGFPLLLEGEVLGVLEFFMHRYYPFDENLIKTLNNITHQISIFIGRENAKQKAFEGLEFIKSTEALVVEYKKAKEAAESASKVKSEFLANMSHELRTPLNAILGYSEIMQEDLENLEGLTEFKRNLRKVIGSGKHLLSLINDILDLSKIESGKMDLFLEKFSVKPFIEELESMLVPLMEKNHNMFSYNISPEVDYMYSDMLRVRQSLLNLLDNAAKFTKEGKVSLDVQLITQENNKMVQFVVQDTGIGMSEQEMQKLFQTFTQGDASTTRKYGGVGLGLYISRWLVKMLGGEITVKSVAGEGSTFTLILPQRSVVSFSGFSK